MVVLILAFLAFLPEIRSGPFLLRKYRHQLHCVHRHQNRNLNRMHFFLRILFSRPELVEIYLVDCSLEAVSLVPELSSDVDVGSFGSHGESYDESSFY